VLHSHGFVHEHVEVANIFAVGDYVKLRSDCIREAPEGEQGAAAKKRDVHDLAVVLLQALTQQRTLEGAARDLPLPSPFDQVVRKALSGEWGLTEIKAALPTVKRPVAAPAPVVVVAPAAASAAGNGSASGNGTGPIKASATANGTAPVAAASPAGLPGKRGIALPPAVPGAPRVASRPAAPATTSEAQQIALPLAAAEPETKAADSTPFSGRFSSLEEESATGRFGRPGLIVAGTLAGLLALGIGWHFSTKPSTTPASKPAAATAGAGLATAAAPATAATAVAGKPSASVAAGAGAHAKVAQKNTVAPGHVQWRAVAYTFNHQDQAQKKSESIAQKHPELRPEVFTPNGHAPFLVTVGGAMGTRDEAMTLAQKSRTAGMPHDTYVQNYTGKAH
jgi:hypothetical protein